MIAEKISHYFPGSEWNMTGETYDKLEWFGPGVKPTEAELDALEWPVVLVPAAVTPRQMRLALIAQGMMPQVEAYVATLDEAATVEWEYATEVARDNALIAAAQTGLSMTDAQVDDLFRLAATL